MTTYQELLREHYVQKRKKRPDFSLRAFARQLGMTPGGVSRLFNGKMNLSLARAMDFASKLGFNEKDTENFLNLVQLEKAKSSEVKEKIMLKIERARGTPVFELSIDHFKVISEWYPMAILKIASEPKMDRSLTAIAKKLGITSAETQQAVERLKRLELIEEDSEGKLRRLPEEEVQTQFKQDHEAARKYYVDVIEKQKRNIEEEPARTRAISAKVLVFDDSQLEAVRKLNLEYQEKLLALSARSVKKEKVYQALSTVFEIKGK